MCFPEFVYSGCQRIVCVKSESLHNLSDIIKPEHVLKSQFYENKGFLRMIALHSFQSPKMAAINSFLPCLCMPLLYGEIEFISLSFESGLAIYCFDQQNAIEVIFWDFWPKALRRLGASASLLLEFLLLRNSPPPPHWPTQHIMWSQRQKEKPYWGEWRHSGW